MAVEFGPPLATNSEPESGIQTSPVSAGGKGDIQAFNDSDGPSFSDLLDVLNPLQHIPLINTLYQHLTGDHEGAVADVVGGTLYGGVIGLGVAVANLVVQDSTGKSIGDNVIAMFSDDDADKTTAIAGKDAGSPAESDTQPKAAATVEPPAVTTTPLPPAVAAAPAADGTPVTAGDYLVFGGSEDAVANSAAGKPVDLVPSKAAEAMPGKPVDLMPSKAADAMPSKPVTLMPSKTAEAIPGGPRQAGDFMVFGDAGQELAASSQPTTGAADQPVVVAQQDVPRQGDFMVFGANSPAAASLPQATPPAAPTAAVPAAADKPLSSPARTFAVPARRASQTPPQSLPLPTTGPGAVPGNAQILANSRREASPEGSAWFVNNFNQAMDRYNRAAGLSNGPTATPTPTPSPSPSPSPTTLN